MRNWILRPNPPVIAAALCALLSMAPDARASTLYVGTVTYGSSDPKALGRVVSFTYNGTTYNNNVYAGQIPVSFKDAQHVGDMYAYCVDLNHDFTPPSHWTVNLNNTGSIYGQLVTNRGQIAYLVENYGHDKLQADKSAGLQAAIWQLEYGTSFKLLSSSPAAVTNAFNTYLGYVHYNAVSHTFASTPPTDKALGLDPNPTNQDLGSGHHPQGFVVGAPEPGSLALFSGILLCLGARMAIRSRKSCSRGLPQASAA